MNTNLALPLSVDPLIPHRSPVRMVDRLIQFENFSGIVESVIRNDNLFLKEGGELEPCAMIELIAQSFAAVKGYGDLLNGKFFKMGFLVTVKEIQFTGRARIGDRLHIVIEPVGETDDFAIGEGKVMRGDDVIAKGRIMVWLVNETA
jgi:predicted hotdog family 3-hydroxylacyl-ACP dehydratase